MYKEHQIFKRPADLDIPIWRYLDFTKYVSLLDQKSLFFCRSDLLADSFEGSYPKLNVTNRSAIYDEIVLNIKSVSLKNVTHMPLKDISKHIRFFTYINSWHMNEHESAAMWSLYLKSEEGVAIKSTFKKLCDSFNGFPEDVYVGTVYYIDYEIDLIPENNILWPFLFKRKSFEHEREVRAVLTRWPIIDEKFDLYREPSSEGEYIPIDLFSLIDTVYVSPTAKTWFNKLVKSVTRKYGLKKEVLQSKLSEGPVF